MKEIKKSVGQYESLMELEQAIMDDNDRLHGNRRKMKCYYQVRNAFIENLKEKVYFYSRGYGIEYVFSEEEKNRLVNG